MDAHDQEFMKLVNEAKPQSLGVVRAKDLGNLGKAPKAVLFVAEGSSIDDEDLMVEVVGLNAATMVALVARRC